MLAKTVEMKQILWERGWWIERMSTSENVSTENNMTTILGNLSDFKNERSALQHAVENQGNILLLSFKPHPGIAGVGFEYSCGISKFKFYEEMKNELAINLHRNIVASMY